MVQQNYSNLLQGFWNCSVLPVPEPGGQLNADYLKACHNILIAQPDLQVSALWMNYVHNIAYYALSILLVMGLVFCLANVFFILHKIADSIDFYFLGLSIADVALIISGVALQFPRYVGHQNEYQSLYGILVSLHSWFWYCSLWMLVVACLDLWLTKARKNQPSTSITQSIFITILVFAICLISATPQFFAYDVIKTKESSPNHTVLITVLSDKAQSDEYRQLYFWYMAAFTVLLPYPMLVFITQPMTYYLLKYSDLQKKYESGSLGRFSYKRTRKENMLLRMCIFLSITTFILTVPKAIHQMFLARNPMLIHRAWHACVSDLLSMIFYLNFVTHIVIHSYYYSNFRVFDANRAINDRGCC